MKNLTISAKLVGLTLFALLLLGSVAAAGLLGSAAQDDAAELLARTPAAMRGVVIADMHHDAVNSAVTQALVANDGAEVIRASKDVDEAVANLVDALQTARDSGVSAKLAELTTTPLADAVDYGAAAQSVLKAVSAGESTDATMAEFRAAFTKLEKELPALATEVERTTKRAKQDEMDAASSAKRWTITIAAVGVVTLAGGAFFFTRSLVRRLKQAAAALTTGGEGDLTVRVDSEGGDELAEMGAAVNTAISSLAAVISDIGDHSATLASASEELTAVSSQLAASAQETSAQAGVVSAAAGQVSDNVAVVAAGTGEMTASIQEISHGAQDAVSVADQAARVAQATNDTVAKLGVSSAEIGNVVKVITSIAEQTNLLALNATIEAARAGEAGKGFAVVAHEVKELASATAAATADISDRIAAIQTDAAESVRAIGEITDIIGRVGETQASIASAVEQQTATTNEIGRNVSEAADNSNEIARNISGVAQSAQDASTGATNTLDTAAELSRMAGELQLLVTGFRC